MHRLLAGLGFRRDRKPVGSAGEKAVADAAPERDWSWMAEPDGFARRLADLDAVHTIRRLFIMGCGRSGTWLLTAVMSTFDDVEVVARETGVEDFAFATTDRSILVMKRGDKAYERVETIPDAIEIIYMIRHPFDVLTSFNPNSPAARYHIAPHRWLGEMLALQYLVETERKNLLVIRYEDLVAAPRETQRRIAATLRLTPARSIDEIDRSFDAPQEAVRAMHGQRPVDANSVNRFRSDPEGIAHLRKIRPRLGRLLSWVAETYGYDVEL